MNSIENLWRDFKIYFNQRRPKKLSALEAEYQEICAKNAPEYSNKLLESHDKNYCSRQFTSKATTLNVSKKKKTSVQVLFDTAVFFSAISFVE